MIEMKEVSFRYDGEENSKLVLEKLNLMIEKGSFVAILGHNGSGKSTVAKLCNGILVPESGTVTVNGMDTKEEEHVYDIRQTVGMVFQNPDNQIIATIVEEDVAFGPENLGVPPGEIRKRVDEALKAVGIYELRGHEPHKLSGGQKQRLAIAGIIAMTPQCIVLDEPTAMLDPRGRSEVMQTVERLNREQGITIVHITHFMDEAVKADRVIVINQGKILLDGTPKEVFSQIELLKSVGLDVPEAAELAYTLRKDGFSLPEGILIDKEFIENFYTISDDIRGI